MKQIKEDKLCIKCAGCNRLENEEFEGIYRCKNFFELRKEQMKNGTYKSTK